MCLQRLPFLDSWNLHSHLKPFSVRSTRYHFLATDCDATSQHLAPKLLICLAVSAIRTPTHSVLRVRGVFCSRFLAFSLVMPAICQLGNMIADLQYLNAGRTHSCHAQMARRCPGLYRVGNTQCQVRYQIQPHPKTNPQQAGQFEEDPVLHQGRFCRCRGTGSVVRAK